MNLDKIVVMNFSEIYKEAKFWKEEESVWVEAGDISGTNCYCDEKALEEIRRRIAEFSVNGIHFIDSGNYHYMSKIWLEKIEKPFLLLVFDNHTDMQLPAFGGLLSCGGWIAESLTQFDNLKKVILVGPDQEAYDQVEERFKEKTEFLSRESLAEDRKDTKEEPQESDYETYTSKAVKCFIRFFQAIPADLPLYISIDKDVLCPGEACTTWSQGDMTVQELLECLKVVSNYYKKNNGEILGVDICGECEEENGGDSHVNDSANSRLLEFFRTVRETGLL